jgi:hypothetical protein
MASDTAPAAAPVPAPRTDRSPWNWLLILPIVLPVLTPLFNFDSPRLWGFPAFYWLQFAFILVGVATTSVVYQMTRRPRPTAPTAAAAPVSPATPASSAAPAPPATPTSPVAPTSPAAPSSPAEGSDE